MLHVVIGTALGALFGGGASVVSDLVAGKAIRWKGVVSGVVGGAALGAVASLTFGGGLLAGSTVARVGGLTAAGALGGAGEQTTDNLLHGRRWSDEVGRRALTGAAVGAGTGVAGKLAAKPAAALARTRIARGAADAARRLTGRVASAARTAWQRYLAALERRPILTKTLTAGAIGGAGDVIAQKLQGKERLDMKRLAFMTAWSMLWAAPGHYWFNALERWLPGTTPKALLGKLALERFLWTPPTTVLTLGAKALYDGEGLDGAGRAIRRDFAATYGSNWLLWPAANLVAFKWIPLNLRIPFMNAVGLGWGVALSSIMYGDEAPVDDAADAPAADAPAQPASSGMVRRLGALGE